MSIIDEFILMAMTDEIEEPVELVLKEVEEDKIPEIREKFLAFLLDVYGCEFSLAEMEESEEEEEEEEDDDE